MTFLAPQLFIYLLAGIALGLGAILWGRQRRKKAINLLVTASQGGKSRLVSCAAPRRRHIRRASIIAILILVGFAMLRPSAGTVWTEHRLPAKSVVLLLDVSKSMGVNDSEGLSRMEAAKLWCREFIAKRPTDRIGLVTFSGIAFPECPATRDRSVLNQRIDTQFPGILPVGGTNLQKALEQAQEFLGEEAKNSCIILLSDGDEVAGNAEEALAKLEEASIPVHTVSFGNPITAGVVPNKTAKKEVKSKADPAGLKSISTRTGGSAIAGSVSDVDASIAGLLSSVDAIHVDGKNILENIFARPIEVYQYPLTVAILLILLRMFLPLRSKKWHPIAALVVCMLTLTSQPAHAQASLTATANAKPFTNYEDALNAATRQSKPLLILFTGSDWSKKSIAFEQEIYSHPVFQQWAKSNVVLMLADLPRKTIPQELRDQNRNLASRFSITSYPTGLFLTHQEVEIARLGYDSKGPASWVDRARAILQGDKSAGDSARSIGQLSSDDKDTLNTANTDGARKAALYYNHALKTEQEDPELALENEDRFDLLIDLLQTSYDAAGKKRPALAFPPLFKMGALHQMRGRSIMEKDISKIDDALSLLNDAYSYYTPAAALQPANAELTANLTLLMEDIAQAEQRVAFRDAYKKAVNKTSAAHTVEDFMNHQLSQWVTTSKEANDAQIKQAAEAIADLVLKSEQIDFEKTEDFRKALSHIQSAPNPHSERYLETSQKAIRAALDLLVPPQQQQQQQQDEDGEDESDSNDGDRDEEEDSDAPRKERENNAESDRDRDLSEEEGDSALKKSEKDSGNLRDRMLDALKDKHPKVSGENDR